MRALPQRGAQCLPDAGLAAQPRRIDSCQPLIQYTREYSMYEMVS